MLINVECFRNKIITNKKTKKQKKQIKSKKQKKQIKSKKQQLRLKQKTRTFRRKIRKQRGG